MQKPSLTYSLVTIADNGIGSAARLFDLRFGRSVQEIRVLRLVRDSPGITFTDLARLTRVERSATSRMLTRLIEAGLVLRTGSLEDARRFTLTITRKGQALCAKADPLTEELEALMLEPLTRSAARNLPGDAGEAAGLGRRRLSPGGGGALPRGRVTPQQAGASG